MTTSSADGQQEDALLRLAADISLALDGVDQKQISPDDKRGSNVGTQYAELESVQAGAKASTLPNSTASSSPSAQFATPASAASPETAVVPLEPAEVERKASTTSNGTHTKRPSLVGRPRSGSGFSMLARLTSRGSSSNVHKASQSTDSAMSNPYDPSKPVTKPKLDKAALSRQKSKYKSGVNLENSDFLIGRAEEPYAAATSPAEERTQDQVRQAENEAILRELASAGGTKALLARANDAGSIGVPYFPTAQRSAMDVSAQAQAQTPAFRPNPFPYRGSANGETRGAQAGSATPRASPPSVGHADAPQSSEAANKFNSETAQQVLQNAREAVAMSNAAVSRKTSPTMMPGNAAQPSEVDPASNADDGTTAATKPALTSSKSRKRLSFLSFGGGNSSKNDVESASSSSSTKKTKGKKGKAAAVEAIDADASEFDRDLASVSSAPASIKSTSPDGTTTPGGTASRRRFRDTRELGLVASQLAAEALMPPSIHNGSYASLSSTNVLMAPVPAFASEGRSNSSNSSLHGSPLSGSPRLGSMSEQASRYEAPRAAFATRKSPGASPSTPFATQSANISGLPSDMLTGLSDGPYPALPPKLMDFTDPFSAPGSLLDHGGSSIRSGASSSRNSVPNIGVNERRSRGASSGSTQTWAGQATGPRRSIMQMSMHNPEQELQGLTKLPKSARSTPFGSRAPSRQVTPRSSTTNLREASKEAALVAGSNPNGGTEASIVEAEKGKSKNRLSLFKKNRSQAGLASSSQLHPPMPQGVSDNVNRFSSQSKISTSNDSTTSNRNSENTALTTADGDQTSLSNPSANSLVKMPSPSMTSTSGSSHDRSVHAASSSDGDNNTQTATSAMTTPEVAPSKINLTNPSPTALPAPRTTVSPMTTIAAPSHIDVAPLPVVQAMQMPSPTSTIVAAKETNVQPISVSTMPPPPPPPPTAPQATLPRSTSSRLGKFASRFAKSSTNLHEMASSKDSARSDPTSGFASKSQTHLPAYKKRDGNRSGAASSPTPTGKKFDSFRASLKRDWFI